MESDAPVPIDDAVAEAARRALRGFTCEAPMVWDGVVAGARRVHRMRVLVGATLIAVAVLGTAAIAMAAQSPPKKTFVAADATTTTTNIPLIPDVAGRSLEAARQLHVAAGFSNLSLASAASREIPAGTVVRTVPAAAERAPVDTVITVSVTVAPGTATSDLVDISVSSVGPVQRVTLEIGQVLRVHVEPPDSALGRGGSTVLSGPIECLNEYEPCDAATRTFIAEVVGTVEFVTYDLYCPKGGEPTTAACYERNQVARVVVTVR